MEKRGLLKLGLIQGLKPNEKGENCFTSLSQRIKERVGQTELDDFIESPDFHKEYIDEEGIVIDERQAFAFRFKLPWTDIRTGQSLYGLFTRKKLSDNFVGVKWTLLEWNYFRKYGGFVNPGSWSRLKELSGVGGISQYTIGSCIKSEIEYYNGAGYKQFDDGTPVVYETGTFIKFTTEIKTLEGETIVGWFTKNHRKKYEGLFWGTEKDFKAARKETQEIKDKCCVGRMIFESIESCNDFLQILKKKTIPEPWEYKHRKDPRFHSPILKSYLEFELDRLLYEEEILNYQNRIVYSQDKQKVLFNTNLIDKFGHDLIIIGNASFVLGKLHISDLEISPSKMKLKQLGFDSQCEPMPPKFFKDINEIVFHCEWEIDQDMQKYEHIIEERKERFPERYRELSADDLGSKLDNAIEFAKRIAQRNYKFIVPMYYPTEKRIQLLMPIYLETSYTSLPDFALVLTPHVKESLYTTETILGLDEVYQDARLIAKPEDSWLNPEIIE